jgi:hypothetical protein
MCETILVGVASTAKARPVTRGEKAPQLGVKLSPTDQYPRQRNGRRLELKTAQHLLTDQGPFWNTLRVEGPLCLGGSEHGSSASQAL